MDPNQILIWIVTGATLLSAARHWYAHRFRHWGWQLIFAIVLAVLGLGLYFRPESAGYLAGTVWGLLVLIPAVGSNWQASLIAQARFTEARWVAEFLSWLHPLDGWEEAPRLMRALELLHLGRREEAEEVLDKLSRQERPMGWIATLQLFRLNWQWAELRQWVEDHPDRNRLLHDPTVIINYVRAFGELDDQQGMLNRYQVLAHRLEKAPHQEAYHVLRMMTLALCGQVKVVAEIFDGPLSTFDEALRDFWIATAYQVAGETEHAFELLQHMRPPKDVALKTAVKHRLSQPLKPLPDKDWSLSTRAVLRQIESEEIETIEHSTLREPPPGIPWLTVCLIAVNLTVFAFQPHNVPLHSQAYVQGLHDMGALLIPPADLIGDSWRLVAAGFLHFGVMHLAMNLAGLFYFGRFVERVLGWWRFLICYFACGIGAMLVVVGMSLTRTQEGGHSLVGASGSVMGLVGASLAILLGSWIHHNTSLARRETLLLVGLVLMQTTFDFSTPFVSAPAHLSGLVIGFVLGWVLRMEHSLPARGTATER